MRDPGHAVHGHVPCDECVADIALM